MKKPVIGYSREQVAIHWTVVVLVLLQFAANASVVDTWNAFIAGDPAPGGAIAYVYLHILLGILVFLLVIMRLFLRFRRGVPHPPPDEPRAFHIVAELVHWSIYVLLVSLPITGAAAWYLAVVPAAAAHSWLTTFLLGAIALHVGGALFQHLVRRSGVLLRMFRPEPR